MTLNANRVQWTGVIFNPCGTVEINAGEVVAGTEHLRGTIIGLRVRINNEGFTMIGTGPDGSAMPSSPSLSSRQPCPIG